jgi:signal transduction histidine kinase
MANLALVASNPGADAFLARQWAHDMRNLLATIGLHLDTLQRLSGPHGAKAAHASHALITKVTGMCNDAIVSASQSRMPARRRFDVVATVRHVTDLLSPMLPAGLRIECEAGGPVQALANSDDVFRIVFNLLHNILPLAADNAVHRVCVAVKREDNAVTIQVSDDGPGLPRAVRDWVFRGIPAKKSALRGHGLAIARELAERNGTTLSCSTSPAGTTFSLQLVAVKAIELESPVTRNLG